MTDSVRTDTPLADCNPVSRGGLQIGGVAGYFGVAGRRSLSEVSVQGAKSRALLFYSQWTYMDFISDGKSPKLVYKVVKRLRFSGGPQSTIDRVGVGRGIASLA